MYTISRDSIQYEPNYRVLGRNLGSFFSYHIPKNAVYSAFDVINMLNGKHCHAILAKSSNPFYSFGTACDAFLPSTILFGFAALAFWGTTSGPILTAVLATCGVALLAYQLNIPTTARIKHNLNDGFYPEYLIADHYHAALIPHHRKSPERLEWNYYLKAGEGVVDDKFTASEIAYLFNTRDVVKVLTHQVDQDYAEQLTGSSWSDRVIMVDDSQISNRAR